MKKHLLSIVATVFFSFAAVAQQEQQYTQFMFNKLAFNPGYAGSFGSPEISAIYRQQWLGLEGAPGTQAVSYHDATLNNRVGIGANLVRNSIGISKTITADVNYAYRIPVRRGYLGVGIRASIRHLRQDWTDSRLHGSQDLAADDAVPMEVKRKVLPNFGFGLYYDEDKYFVGLSLPRLVSGNIDFAEAGSVLSREAKHVFLTGGMVLKLNDAVEFRPQMLLKYAVHAPLNADLNATFRFQKRFNAGLTYRTGNGEVSLAGESLDVLAGVQANKNLYIGLSYDVGLTKIRKFSNGSIEGMVRYWISPADAGGEIVSPRPE